ncbi:MAG: TonB-dependent receptor [Bacteroidales bacterium]|nr:TonB-dependent receptor [Bacteroidales bacterium]MCM1147868.1 TonB-dependent receptor [Bacteroidales bacterium]MCM1206711.1 TonB-dependent receptor [Bacillota bacterium]
MADDWDSLRVQQLGEVTVKGVRAQKDAPFAVANVKKQELQEFSKTGRELPFLFSRTPGVLAWSENGVGTGTTYMRIRGAAGSRINVTLDGVALNSPEDQCVFWANMNSFGSLLGSAQIQRGVGTSSNGDGAFGGTISLMTALPHERPSAEVSLSYGSYGTWNFGAQFSTGLGGIRLPRHHLVLEGAYNRTSTDGFIHGTEGKSGNYYGGLTFINQDQNFKLSYKNIGSFESTGQAWSGVTAGNDDYSLNAYDGVRTYKDMYDLGLGKFNSLYERFEPDWNGNWEVSRYRMADGSFWDKTTDNFWYNHSLLSMAWQISEKWSATATAHYTHGSGYYDEFRYDNKLSKFGLSMTPDAGHSFGKRTDFVRKKGLSHDFYGAIAGANYKDSRWDIIGNISAQQYGGNHYGYLTYIAAEDVRDYYFNGGNEYQYYDSDADKTDVSAFAKATFHISPVFSVFADVQYRYVKYMTDGINDKFYENQDGSFTNQRLDIDAKYNFFNPKFGLSFHSGGHNAYVSFARSSREPERNNFTDNGSYPAPEAETLNDFEFGYAYKTSKWSAGLNFYYMGYDNQFVQTGAQSDIGENLTTNVKDSYRMGIELSAGISPLSWLSIEGNAALSRNRIKNFDEYVENWEADMPDVIHYNNSTLSFSPSAILNGFVDVHYKGFQGVWHTNFVSRQYLDNSENADRSLPCYSATNVTLRYTLGMKQMKAGIREAVFGLSMNNIFNRRYAASGWVYSAISPDSGFTNDNRYYQIGYIPMAGFTVMGSVTLKF